MSAVCGICGAGANLPPPVLALAAVGATWLGMIWTARRAGLSAGLSGFAGAVGFLAALWAGHLQVVFEREWMGNGQDPALLWQFLTGDKAVHGAFVGAGLAAFGILRLARQPFLVYADAWIPALVVGYTLARLACFINGDDFGISSSLPWAVQFPAGTEAYAAHLTRGWITPSDGLSLAVHPTQIYHALIGVAGFAFLLSWRPRWPGDRLAMGMAWYGSTRLLIQTVRDDHWSGGQFIDPAQWFSLAMVAAAFALWIYQARRAAQPGGASPQAG